MTGSDVISVSFKLLVLCRLLVVFTKSNNGSNKTFYHSYVFYEYFFR